MTGKSKSEYLMEGREEIKAFKVFIKLKEAGAGSGSASPLNLSKAIKKEMRDAI